MAAIINIGIKIKILMPDGCAHNKPAVNNKESPGKKGIITSPVSTKMIRNKIP